MKKHFLTFSIALLAISYCATANTVSVPTAQTIAVNFFKLSESNLNPHINITASLKYTQTEPDNTVDFYVFDISPVKGFVIVSANDNSKPVIAYSNESNFALGFEQSPIHSWIKTSAAKIYNGIKLNVTATPEIANAWSAYLQGIRPSGILKSNPVAPLLGNLAWNQDPFYNELCPYNTTDQQRTVTGCVATAMAQIMKYWNYPIQGKGSYSYTPGNYPTQSANFDTTTYRWQQMPNALITYGNLSVATLMYQCGVSVAMNYGDMVQGGSGAFVLQSETWGGGPCAQSAYVDNFSYDANTLQGVQQNNYSNTDWINLMEAELNAGRVIQYEGDDQNAGGHTWVCDGYNSSDWLHMNWGWGGSSNGYFDINNLNAGGYNFNQRDAALIGIQPPATYIRLRANATTDPLCLGGSTAIVANGPASATYSWTPSTGVACVTCASTTVQPLATTVYTVTADSAGVSSVYNLVITVNPAITASATPVSTSCFGNTDGGGTATPTGGTSGYTYLWSNGRTSQSVSQLAGGNYTVTITDAKGCTASANETVTQPAAINIVLTPSNSHCGPADAILSANVTGGFPTYFYSWSNGVSTENDPSLATGTYTLTINDNHGCSATASASITSTGSPVQIQITTAATNPVAGTNNGSASVLSITGGTPPYATAQWSNGQIGNTVTNLSAGTYTVTIMDQNGCQQSSVVTLTAVTGISSVNQDISFSVYPNPAKSEITVELGKVEDGTILSVKNVLGQTIITQSVTGLTNKINLSHFADGVYFIELRQAEKMSVKEIVVRQ